MDGSPLRRAESSREALPKGKEWSGNLLEDQEWSEVPPGGPCVPLVCLGVVRNTSRWAWSGRVALGECQEGSGGHPRGPGVLR